MLRTILDALYLLTGYLAGLFLIVIFLLMMGLSIGREVGVNIPAGDDFASWCMAAMAFLGLAHTFKSGEMIRVGLLIDRLQGRTRWAFEMVSLVLGFGFVAFFAWHAAHFTFDSYRFNDMAQGARRAAVESPARLFGGARDPRGRVPRRARARRARRPSALREAARAHRRRARGARDPEPGLMSRGISPPSRAAGDEFRGRSISHRVSAGA